LYTLNNDFATRFRYQVAVVGCGGTGGFVAEGLCRILPSNVPLLLIDHDRVEERNLLRQNFFREDLGNLKSEALAKRLSRKYGRPVAYSTMPVSFTPLGYSALVLGCVDNGLARRDIARKFANVSSPPPAWWIDAGNGENFGQVLIGNSNGPAQYRKDEKGERVYYMPLPTQQRPELLRQQPPARSCAEVAEQGPTINQSMAVLVVEVTRRLIAGTCPWIQLYLDMNTGILQPVFATPEVIEDMAKHKIPKGG
jgi:hypothetical protein